MTNTPVSLHDTLAAVIVKARAALMPHERAAADARLVDWFDGIEDTVRDLIAPLLEPMLASDQIPTEVKDLLAVGAHPEQANELSVILFIAGALIFPLVQSFLAPASQAVANVAWAIPGNDVRPLSPAELAVAAIKNVLGDTNKYSEAAKWGLAPDKYDVIEASTGEAIGIEEAILLWRRGDIDETELERVVHYSNVRNDFMPDILKLRYVPPGAGEVIAGSVKGHLDDATAQQYLNNAGMDPANFAWLKATAGRPYGVMEALNLLNRGVIDEARVIEVIRQSDINDAFANDILNLRVHYPPLFQVLRAVTAGTMTDARATQILEYEGYPQDIVQGMIGAAHSTKTSAVKEASASQTIRAYEEQLITNGEATARLEKLKYSTDDAAFMLQIADNARVERFRNSGISRIHNRYVAHKIDEGAAASQLAPFGITGVAATSLLGLWTDERNANTAVLSLSQLQRGLRDTIFTLDQFIGRVQALGYSGIDVKVCAAEAWPPGKTPPEILALDPATL